MVTTDAPSDPRLARAVPLPIIRADAMLRFRTVDLCDVANTLAGPDGYKSPPAPSSWLLRAIDRLEDGNVEFVIACLRGGLKAGDGFTPLALEDPADLRFAPGEVIGPIVDALTLGLYGGTFAELKARRTAEAALAAEAQAIAAAAEAATIAGGARAPADAEAA